MAMGLIGRKIGMTRIFTEDGASIPVSVVAIKKNRVSQIKKVDSDGYNAIQLTAGEKKPSRVNKAMAGHFAAAQVEAGDLLCEFRMDSVDAYTLGQELNISDVFVEGQKVDVSGISKG